MYLITIVWTCVILTVHQAESGKYTTPEGFITVARTALPKPIEEHFEQVQKTNLKKVLSPENKSIAQAIADRLVKKKERQWGKCGEIEDVEVHTVLAFTYVVFKPERVETKMKVDAVIQKQYLEKFFSVEKKKRMEKKLEEIKVGTDRHVLQIGTGVRIEKSFLHRCNFVDIHACFVLFTTDELLPLILKDKRIKCLFHAKTTLYAAEYSLRKQYDKNVLYEYHWSYRLRMSKKSLEYIIINKESDNPRIKRVDGNPIGGNDNVGLSQIEWNEVICDKNIKHLSCGFGAWEADKIKYLFIVTHSHKLKNMHSEIPVSKAIFEQKDSFPTASATPGLIPSAETSKRSFPAQASTTTESHSNSRRSALPVMSPVSIPTTTVSAQAPTSTTQVPKNPKSFLDPPNSSQTRTVPPVNHSIPPPPTFSAPAPAATAHVPNNLTPGFVATDPTTRRTAPAVGGSTLPTSDIPPISNSPFTTPGWDSVTNTTSTRRSVPEFGSKLPFSPGPIPTDAVKAKVKSTPPKPAYVPGSEGLTPRISETAAFPQLHRLHRPEPDQSPPPPLPYSFNVPNPNPSPSSIVPEFPAVVDHRQGSTGGLGSSVDQEGEVIPESPKASPSLSHSATPSTPDPQLLREESTEGDEEESEKTDPPAEPSTILRQTTEIIPVPEITEEDEEDDPDNVSAPVEDPEDQPEDSVEDPHDNSDQIYTDATGVSGEEHSTIEQETKSKGEVHHENDGIESKDRMDSDEEEEEALLSKSAEEDQEEEDAKTKYSSTAPLPAINENETSPGEIAVEKGFRETNEGEEGEEEENHLEVEGGNGDGDEEEEESTDSENTSFDHPLSSEIKQDPTKTSEGPETTGLKQKESVLANAAVDTDVTPSNLDSNDEPESSRKQDAELPTMDESAKQNAVQTKAEIGNSSNNLAYTAREERVEGKGQQTEHMQAPSLAVSKLDDHAAVEHIVQISRDTERAGVEDKRKEETENMQPTAPVPKEQPTGTDSVALEPSVLYSRLGSFYNWAVGRK